MVTPEHVRARKKAWSIANADKERARRAAAYLANRDAILARNKAWKAANRERVRATNRKSNRKAEGVEAPTGEAKAGQCEICNRETKLVLDHCHKTGKLRGWLCNTCNMGLGYLQDDPAILLSAATYLKKGL